MKKTLTQLAIRTFAFIVGILLAVCILTPEKTKGGDYVQPWQYWTSAEYIKANF
jgi:hypothetical protein